MRRIAGILLAAGASTRYGTNKLLAPLADGTPMALAAARKLVSVLPDSIVVVRPEDETLPSLLKEETLRMIVCADASRGMAASLVAGVRASTGADGWVVTLADMPWIKVETIRRVARALERGAPLAAPFCDGRRGHPVGFGRALESELLALDGDTGARAVLERNAAQLVRIDVEDRGVLADVDRPSDLVAGDTDTVSPGAGVSVRSRLR